MWDVGLFPTFMIKDLRSITNSWDENQYMQWGFKLSQNDYVKVYQDVLVLTMDDTEANYSFTVRFYAENEMVIRF